MAHVALEKWFREQPGSFMHHDLHLSKNETLGVHWHTEKEIPEDTALLTVPHGLAMSYLNALVDVELPVFRTRRQDFTIEQIGFFYLMWQYVYRDKSFWRPYLESLPKPDDELTTPLWFDDEADLLWLRYTDVEHTMSKRRLIYRQYYESGISIFKDAGIEVAGLTWNLFRWAVTIFTSRSFLSRSIAPNDSKYWTAYRSGDDGRRQAVLLDMQHAPAADKDFSVLFPVMDIGNHDPATQVEWLFDPGRFSIRPLRPVSMGQLCNNYGPKSNDELLQGYGFCIDGNPYDVVLLTLKAPSANQLPQFRQTHPGLFDETGEWSSDRATFRLARLNEKAHISPSIEHLPESLLDLLHHVISCDADVPLHTNISTEDVFGYAPRTARIVLLSLAAKLQKLQSISPVFDPGRPKQVAVRIYRESQLSILTDYVKMLQAYLSSLILLSHTDYGSRPAMVMLKSAISIASAHNQSAITDFLQGIEATANTADLDTLISAGWEEDIWVLFLTWTWLDAILHVNEPCFPWSAALLEHYGAPDVACSVESERMNQARELEDIVRTAANVKNQTLWSNELFTAKSIAQIGGRTLDALSFLLPVADDSGVTQPKLLMWL